MGVAPQLMNDVLGRETNPMKIMNQPIDPDKIPFLLNSVEQYYGRKPHSPREFKWLSQRIYDKTGESVSDSTLRRLWGYNKKHGTPYRYTLDILCRYMGYENVDDFFERETASPTSDNQQWREIIVDCSPEIQRLIRQNKISVGQQLRVDLSDTEYVVLRFLGGDRFAIVRTLD